MAYDGISPQLTDSGIIILENSKNKCVFDVEFDEPVQGKNSVFDAQYGWTITPRRTTDQMSDISVQVYDQTSKRTYNGTVLGYGNLENTRIRVETDSLPAGHDYTLYVTGVSDDVGNTTGTVNKAFNIDADAAVDSEFKVLSIFADKDYTVDTASDKISHYGVIDLDKTGNGKGNTAKEAIYVEFSEGFKLAPITNTVLQPTNWTVNGTPLTSDNADILSGIPYVEGGNRQMYANGVTIVLPAGFLKDVENVVVKLSSSVQGVSGKNISGKTTLSTPSIFSGSYFNKQVNTDMEVINLTEGDTIKTVLNNTPNLVENN